MARQHSLTEEELQKLVEQAKEGSTKAFGRIYDHFVDAVYRYSAFRVNEDIAEDITSEIFVKAWEKLHLYKSQKGVPFSAWLFRIARHTVIDAYRQQRDIVEVPEEYPDEDELNTATARITQKHLVQTVRRSMEQLPKRYRDILELAFLADLPHSEIARVLRMNSGSVRVLKFRALKKLEQCLPPELQQEPIKGPETGWQPV